MKRQEFLRELRRLIKQHGSENIIYVDETGFKNDEAVRLSGWAERGRKIYCDVRGKRSHTTNLIMGIRGSEWLAPMLFERSCIAQTVNAWLEQGLIKELTKPSVIVMDNAPFHSKPAIRSIAQRHGHTVLFLPPYSPDFNPIEQVFATINKRRLQNTTLNLKEFISSLFI